MEEKLENIENRNIQDGKTEGPEREPTAQEKAAEIRRQFDEQMAAAEMLYSGVFKLRKPIEDGGRVYEELKYDFTSLTAAELCRAIDSATDKAANVFNLTERQALALFAAAAAKETKGLDATDIRERLSAMDGVAAIRVATIFFDASFRAGSLRFSKE